MPVDLSNILVIGVSSRALFDLEKCMSSKKVDGLVVEGFVV